MHGTAAGGVVLGHVPVSTGMSRRERREEKAAVLGGERC
jgi:hypothetical protein